MTDQPLAAQGEPPRYRCIVVDPPWRYTTTGVPGQRGSAHSRSAEDHYPTMTNGDIAALPVGDMAGPSAHLYLWVTNPLLFAGPRHPGPSPHALMEGWGFRYVTLLTWHKLGSPGMGFYFRGDTEHVLFGVRGAAGIEASRRVSNHFAAARTAHSAKPARFYEIVEAVSPEPRLEMFARRRRMGWDVWGNEAPPVSEARTQLHAGLVT